MVGVGALRRRRACGCRMRCADADAGRARPTSAPACPAAPTSATAATARRRSCSATSDGRHRRAARRGRRRPRSSSTAGGCPATPRRTCGRSASASTSYVPLAEAALTDALKQAGLTADASTTSSSPACTRGRARGRRSASASARGAGRRPGDAIGNTGAAQPGIVLADVLDRAEPGQVIAVVVAGRRRRRRASLRTTDALAGVPRRQQSRSPSRSPRAQRPRLPDVPHLARPARPRAAPPARPDGAARHRRRSGTRSWKFGFAGSRCEECGTRHLPPARVCVQCGAVDQMAPRARWPTCRRTDRHVHHRPAGVLAQPADRRRGASTSTAAAGSGAS